MHTSAGSRFSGRDQVDVDVDFEAVPFALRTSWLLASGSLEHSSQASAPQNAH